MAAPKVDLMPKWKLEEEHKVIFRDVQSGKTGKWPRIKPVDQLSYELWLDTL